MKILFLCHRLPYPPDHGARIRAYHFIRHLSQKNSVTVATLVQTEQELTQGLALNDFCDEVIAEILPTRIRWLQALKALFSVSPSSVAYFWSPRLQNQINHKLKSAKFDAIIVFCAFMAQYVLEWQGGYRVLDYGDLDSAKWAEYARWRAFPLSSGYAFEAKKLRRYERAIARHFHHCAVISQGEMEEFHSLEVAAPCTTIPNGVDTDYFHLNRNNGRCSSAIVFLGRMDYFPNIDGIIYFAREVFPIIQNKRPEVELRIVGSNPTKSVRKLAKIPNVLVTGHVPDVRSFLKDAAVSVAPLRIARGTQNKILESMAMGIPVVATPQAAKGIDAIPGKHLLVAEEPKTFADQVLAILENSQFRSRLVEAGRAQIEHAHVWPAAVKILDDVLSLRRQELLVKDQVNPKLDSK